MSSIKVPHNFDDKYDKHNRKHIMGKVDPNFDFRAKLKAKPNGTEYAFGSNSDDNILKPLITTRGLIFPYTPMISFGGMVNYNEYAFTHTNYKYNSYQNSAPTEITVTGTFTAQTEDEAKYMLAVMNFLKSATKSYFGVSGTTNKKAGTPPVILLFDYLGAHMFKDVPVIIKNYNYTLDDNVDYVPVIFSGNKTTFVPATMVITIILDTQYNTKVLRDDFDLDKFREGKHLDGSGGGRGFI